MQAKTFGNTFSFVFFTEDSFQLGVKPFDDVHALTGSLKLYFRELPEPLVPFDFFSGFVEAISEYFVTLLKLVNQEIKEMEMNEIPVVQSVPR